jgi:diguanylate cyclase (GGDEF)-like protein/PAS domain S-box-containing protein
MITELFERLQLLPDEVNSLVAKSIAGLDQIVIITNNPNNTTDGLKILYVNQAFTRVSGYTKDEVIGLNPSLLQGPETCTQTLQKIGLAIKNEQPIRCELLNYKKNTQKYWIELNLTPLSFNGGACDLFIGYSFDISDYKKSVKEAAETDESLGFVLESAGLGYWDLNLTTNQTKRSLLHDQLFGYQELQKQWSYETFLSHVIEEDKSRVDSEFTNAMAVGGDYDVEFRCKWPDGSVHWLWSKGRFIKNDNNEIVRASGIQADIAEKKNAEAKIYNLAYVDELTQLPNRSAFNKRLNKLMLTNKAQNSYSALLFIDLDDFKVVNDTLGHDMGDALLVKIAERLKNKLLNIDIISRFGGDEFVMLIESISTDAKSAYRSVEQTLATIRTIFSQPFHCKKQAFFSKVSIGVTLFSNLADDRFELLKQADLALYHAKASGKNTHCFFDHQLQLDLIKRTELEADLRNALINNELYLVYQPKVDHEHKMVGMEALIRWRHPSKGIISPADFIPIAEDTGLIVPIGEWVLNQAIAFIRDMPLLGGPTLCTVSINISPVQFKHEHFVERYTAALKDIKHLPNKLILEITETTVLENLDEALLKMNILKEQGITFSLDDFGSGYSSLNYLKLLPISEIKIDKSFIDDIVEDKRNTAILDAIISIALALELSLVVEGVETLEQVQVLNALGAKVFQGFYFSKPLCEEDLSKYMAS